MSGAKDENVAVKKKGKEKREGKAKRRDAGAMQANGKSALKRVGSLADAELGQSTMDSQREAPDDEDEDEDDDEDSGDDDDEHEDDGVAPLRHVPAPLKTPSRHRARLRVPKGFSSLYPTAWSYSIAPDLSPSSMSPLIVFPLKRFSRFYGRRPD